MVRQSFVFALAALMLGGLLTACSGGSGEKQDGNAAQKTDKQPASKEPVELIFYSNAADTKETFDARYGDPIRKKFPNYTVSYIQKTDNVNLPNLVTAGKRIDIYYDSIGNFPDGLMSFNMQLNMADLIKKHNVDLSKFEPTTIEAMKALSNGGMFGLPVVASTLGAYYNQDIFGRFGVPFLKDGMNWDQVVDAALKVTRADGDKSYYGLSFSQAHILRMNNYSLPFVDPKTEKPTINDPRWRTIFETAFTKPAAPEVYQTKVKANSNKLPAGDQFVKTQELGIYVALSDLFNHVDLVPYFDSMKWDMISVPTFKDLPGVGPQLYPTYFSITNNGKFKDEAMEAIKFLASEEMQLIYSKQGNITVLNNEDIRKVYGQDSKYGSKNLRSVFYNKFAPIAPKTIYDVKVEAAYRKDINNMIFGQTDMNTAFRKAEEEANKVISEMKQK